MDKKLLGGGLKRTLTICAETLGTDSLIILMDIMNKSLTCGYFLFCDSFIKPNNARAFGQGYGKAFRKFSRRI